MGGLVGIVIMVYEDKRNENNTCTCVCTAETYSQQYYTCVSEAATSDGENDTGFIWSK